MRGKFDKKIRNILVRTGVLTDDKADEAMEAADKDNGLSYGEVLVEKGFIKDEDFVMALSSETRFPPIDVEKLMVPQEALNSLSQELATHYGVIPISRVSTILTVAVSNPFDLPKFDELSVVTNCELRTVLASERAIKRMIARLYNPVEKQLMDDLQSKGMVNEGSLEVTQQEDDEGPVNVMDLSKLGTMEGETAVGKLVNLLMTQALKEKATDIHIEAFEKATRVRYRIDGSLKEFLTPPKSMHREILTYVKVMAGLNVAERRIPQDGKIQVRYEGRQVDIRVSILPCIHGEKAVLRLLDSSMLDRLKIENLGFESSAENAFRQSLSSSYGLILITGPTGSGKSTTLYAALKETLNPEEHVVTIEDPVEYQLDGVSQVMVNNKRGLTFPVALRAILRQDPDIILVGEMRDTETADIAIKAALTGHLVLSTLHTNDAASSVTRLVDMGIDKFMVASSVVLASAQRLLRRLCTNCRRPIEKLPPEDYLISIGFEERELRDLILYEPVGCEACLNGYRGRFAILEAMQVDENVRRMIIESESHHDIKDYAVQKKGMLTLRRCAIINAIKGKTSLQEVLNMTMGEEF